jgi:hypothetical protein
MFLTKQGAPFRALPKHKERAVVPEKPEPELELVEKEPYQRGPNYRHTVLTQHSYK